jgi:hypothetical protein
MLTPINNQSNINYIASLSTSSNAASTNTTGSTNGTGLDQKLHRAAGDSGASGHYFRVSDAANLINLQATPDPIAATFPNGNVIHSVQSGYLQLPTLTSNGCQVYVFRDEDLTEFSLVAIGQLCDDDCTAHYDKTKMWITDKSDTDIIQGAREPETGLYMIDTNKLTPPTPLPPTRNERKSHKTLA